VAAAVANGCSVAAPQLTSANVIANGFAPARPAPEPRELTADQQVRQAINRLSFGARPGDVERVRAMGVDRWIAEQLQPARIDDRATEQFTARFETLEQSGAALLRAYPPPAAQLAKLAQKQRRDSAQGMAATDASGRPSMSRADSALLQKSRRDSYQFVGELQTARVARAVMSERQLDEVMVDFWANHFNVFAGKDRTRYYLPEFEYAVIRPHSMGNFRDLLGAVAKSPAMLYYLDNWQSVADSTRPTLGAAPRGRMARATPGATRRPNVAGNRRPNVRPGARPMVDTASLTPQQRRRLAQLTPEQRERLMEMTPEQRQRTIAQVQARRPRGLNENYARELMELHTLGVDGGYTQQDVINVARALTGWTLAPAQAGGGFVFRPEVHDAGEKTVLGQTLKAGRGIEDGEQVLDIVARHPATARYIALKLAQRFVSDTPDSALVARAAATFTRTDGDIRETVRTIVTSPEFFSRAAYRSKVKSPYELVVSAMRVMGAQPDSTPRTAQLIARLGQPLYGHAAPDGWPETGESWMNTGAILNRINFGLAVAGARVPGARVAQWPAATELRTASREQQVDGVIATILGGEASSDTRAVLLSGQSPMLKSSAGVDSLVADDARPMLPVMAPQLAPDSAAMRSERRARAQSGGAGETMTNGTTRARQARRPMQTAESRAKAEQAAAGRETAKPTRSQPPFAGMLPTANGLALIVGLALGAPEFQRR